MSILSSRSAHIVININDHNVDRSCKYLESYQYVGAAIINKMDENKDPNPNVSKRYYGSRVQGPWVFGLCWRHNIIF